MAKGPSWISTGSKAGKGRARGGIWKIESPITAAAMRPCRRQRSQGGDRLLWPHQRRGGNLDSDFGRPVDEIACGSEFAPCGQTRKRPFVETDLLARPR